MSMNAIITIAFQPGIKAATENSKIQWRYMHENFSTGYNGAGDRFSRASGPGN
jgi:hypothetical protein